MSDSPGTRDNPPARDALAAVQQAVLRDRATIQQLDRRARTLLDEMRPLARPALPPPRSASRTASTATPAAPSQQASARRPTAGGDRRRGVRLLGVIAGVLLTVTLATWLIVQDPFDRRSSQRESDRSGAEAPPAALTSALPRSAQGVTVVVTRSFESVCVKPPDRHPCDGATLGLWRGDLGAWQALAAQNRLPLPDEDAAFTSAIEFRLEMSDPATRIEVARRSGAAAPLLGAAWLRGAGTTHDVEVELRNLGASTADLGDVQLLTDRGEVLLRLPPGAALPAGIRCRLSTQPAVSNPCDFARDTARQQSASRPAALILRAGTGATIDYVDTPAAR